MNGLLKFIKKSCNNSFGAFIRNYSKIAATNVSATSDQRYVTIDFKNDSKCQSEQLKFPLIWLRDNCQCSTCFESISRSRTIDWTKFKLSDAQLKTMTIDKNLEITWTDNHTSKYDFNWLYERNFSAENRQKYIETRYRPKMKLWSKDEFVMKNLDATEVFETDKGLLKWLEAISRYGVVMIKNAQQKEDQMRRLAERVAYLRRTQFGDEYAVRAVPDAKNYAYTSNPLQHHSDLPYHDYKPGVTLLHYLQQTKSPGAYNLLVDAFYAAERLRKENPNAFKCLSTTLINWCDYGEYFGSKFITIFRDPVICLDYEGNVRRVNQSVPQRDSFFLIDAEKVNEWYEALRLFIDILYSETIYFKAEPGDILAFANIRLLHGRTGYTDTDGDVRHLVGGYLDWDEIYSKWRILSENQQ